MSASSRIGTPIKSGESSRPASSYYSSPPPPSPVIPTSWLAPHEQRWFFVSLFGLIETIKVWDILAPYFIFSPEPTWSSALRVQGPVTALGWTAFEVGVFAAVALLRIPMLSPSGKQLVLLSAGLILWNLTCWFVAEPGPFFQSIHLIGPTALGAEWYWNWFYALKRWREPSHLAGVHKIRLLPYSTATLNPLSLSYCIPPDSPQTIYVPIVFNNSLPNEVSYYIRSLETGHAEVKTLAGSALKKATQPRSKHLLTEGEDEDEDTDIPETDPLSALILKSNDLDVAKLPSVKPHDSLTLVPPKLSSTQQVLFLPVDHPSVVSLKSVLDRHGDRFHITPHKEAVVIECPTGGHFVEESQGQLIKRPSKPQPAELRCQGAEEVVQFQARGVGPLRVGWKKKSKDAQTHGVIEGIEAEEEIDSTDSLALSRKERVSRTHTVPLRVSHDRPGIYTVSLTSVADSLHNTYTPSGPAAERVFNVIPQPSARLDCTGPKELLVGQRTSLAVHLSGLSTEPVEVLYSFTSLNGDTTQRSYKTNRKQESIFVSEPGRYTLLGMKGPCGGVVMEPSSCLVQLVPLPSLDMKVETLHECAMDVGATASFDFSGIPPFVVEYTEQRDRHRPVTRTAQFRGYAGDIVLTPEQEGEYTYTFVSLGDAKYSHVKLNQSPIKQTVHPLASVELLGLRRQRLYACSGDEVEIEFAAKGANPLSLTYHVSYNGRTTNATWTGPPGRHFMRVSVPPELSGAGGSSGRMAITLLSIEDGNGCARRLPAPTVDVEVNRQKPTLRFAKSEKLIITEGQSVKAPLRLTGTAPWEVTYSVNGKPRTVTMRDPNNALTFDQKGEYKLLKVKDANCPGDVLDEADYEIDFKPRPSVRLGSPDDQGKGLMKKTEFCAGEEDQVALVFSGQAPFELGYSYSADGRVSRHTLKSAQDTGILHLAAEPGTHRYDFMDLKDSNYANIPVHIVVDHHVHSRPSVSFSKTNSRPICLDSHLSGDAKVKLEGRAPFKLEVSVRRPASSKVETFSVDVKGHEWVLDVPFIVKDVGRHEVTISSVKDASGCAWDIREADILSTTVEVVESARIVPVSSAKDLCVGDTLDFLLQGKAPWTVEYEWLGKSHKVSSSASRFSRYAEYPGSFSVKSVALKDNQCKRKIDDMERIVHPLPSVKIQEGIQSLREGDEPAAFSVRFTGTAPFSFTYTRSELVGTKWKVVETQTVTDIMQDTYTISSSLPGDYTVTSVSDRFCRYPPLSKGREIK